MPRTVSSGKKIAYAVDDYTDVTAGYRRILPKIKRVFTKASKFPILLGEI